MAATVPNTDWQGSREPMRLWASSMRPATPLPSVLVAWWTGSVSTVTGKNAMGHILYLRAIEYFPLCQSF